MWVMAISLASSMFDFYLFVTSDIIFCVCFHCFFQIFCSAQFEKKNQQVSGMSVKEYRSRFREQRMENISTTILKNFHLYLRVLPHIADENSIFLVQLSHEFRISFIGIADSKEKFPLYTL